MKWYLPSTLAESSPCRSPAITMGSFPRWLAAITQPLQLTSGNTNSLCGAHMLREPEDDKNKKNHAAFRQLLETAFSIFSIKATYKKKKNQSNFPSPRTSSGGVLSKNNNNNNKKLHVLLSSCRDHLLLLCRPVSKL